METNKIFLALSSELEVDRKEFEIFINRKNKEWVKKGVFLELVVWDDFLDALSQTRLQDEYNKEIRQCDIFVMLFFTKVGKYTEEEFETAVGQFKATTKPRIFTYFKDAEITTGSANKNDMKSLWAFQEKLEELRHFQTVYKNIDDLKFKFNRQLDKLAGEGFFKKEHVKEGVKENMKTPVPDQVSPDLVVPLRNAYLNRIFETSRQLSLSGVDPKVASSEAEARLSLDAVYTALLTLTPEAHEEIQRGKSPKKEIKRQSALEQLNRHPRLVLLGDPGSGKSTFVNFVTLCLSGELLGHKDLNLSLLTTPLPVEGEEEAKPQTWDHGALLPVRIILRDFATQGLPAINEKASAAHLWKFIESDLCSATLGKYTIPMQNELLEKGGIVLLDGLDEIPDAERRRIQIKQVVEDFARAYPRCRIMVASRTYAYQREDWRLTGFSEAILSPFNPGQIGSFVDRWYAYISKARGMKTEDARGRAERLKDAIFKSDRLPSLAERPLLLTLMASLHAWRGGSLPEKREELYADTVNLLLDWWESQRIERDNEGKTKNIQPSLAEWLKVDRDKVRALLNELAFKAHQSQPEAIGTADISRGDLVNGLMDLSQNPDVNPAKLVDYLSNRAGILIPRGNKVFTFAHRTFQEYLAACYLTDDDFPGKIAQLARKEPNRWREVTLLAGAKAARGSAFAIWALVDELYNGEPETIKDSMEDVWGAHLAAQAIVETADLTKMSEANRKKVTKIKRSLEHIITLKEFPPRERAFAGVNLARLGDERKDVVTTREMQFCLVPGGSFWMGEDAEGHENDVLAYDFWISRYPVTQAQFLGFVEDGGYKNEKYWKEARDAGVWKDGKIKEYFGESFREESYRFGAPFTLLNHPVVGVTWYEALAFTRWLTGIWRKVDVLPEGWEVRLPSEAEWEKAARGGLEIPAQPHMVSTGDTKGNTRLSMKKNEASQRGYPWGNDPDPNRANYNETGIGATSAVGCFPSGASPYGCEEMSGNVWEWTRSIYREYPYDPKDGRENLEASSAKIRVVRGGSFTDNHGYVRCSCRGRNLPVSGYFNIGFRVMLSPFISEL